MKITPNQFAWVFTIILVALIGWGVYELVIFMKAPAAKIVSIENERKFGELIEENSLSEQQGYYRIQDRYVDSVMQVIQARLMAGLQHTEYDYQFRVIENDEANAFAIPGGKIFVQTGLIQFCNSPEELAAILAHEMGHVEHRHGVNQLIKQIGVSGLLAFITDGNQSPPESIAQNLVSNMFSRDDESEADDFALKLLYDCNLQPNRMGEVFLRMKQKFGDMDGAANLLSTHPELEDRLNKANAYVIQNDFKEIPFDIDWNALQARLNVLERRHE